MRVSRGEALEHFTRTMNWDAGTMIERFERTPGLNPASWKYGQGWRGGTPIQKHRKQTFAVNGRIGWHIDRG